MKLNLGLILLLIIGGVLIFFACKPKNTAKSIPTKNPNQSLKTIQPEWAKNAVIYEVNLRQFSPEGDLKGFEAQLPRLKKLGVDILWLMPIFPISMEKRKAKDKVLVSEIKDPTERKKYKGSPYAVQDFTKVNPDYGTNEEFKALMEKIHGMGMRVILDWVPNHTGWDHKWITENPEYYTKVDGKITDPINPETKEPWGWDDVADLNYDNQQMRKAMIADMKYWITDMNIDGFRMDVAHGVPNDFWKQCSDALFAAGNIFMLAEGEVPAQRNDGYFAADYGWSLHHLLNEVAQGKKKATDIVKWHEADLKKHTRGYHMNFITNHDENSWNGTVEERMGDAADAMSIFTFTFEGMPLIYNGQEAPLKKRLEFFVADPIEWNGYPKTEFYQKLTGLKHSNKALLNGEDGGAVEYIETNDEDVLAYKREKDNSRVITILNFSKEAKEVEIDLGKMAGAYSHVLNQGSTTLPADFKVSMAPWEGLVFAQ